MIRRPALSLALAAAVAVAAVPVPTGAAPALGQWRVAHEPVAPGGEPVDVAEVRGERGERLRVHLDDEDLVHAVFELRPGYDTFPAEGCPTYRIDDGPPVPARLGGGPCRTEGRRVHFSLGRVAAGEVRSTPLLDVMNGSRLELVYPLSGVGYGRTVLGLKGSKQAISAAIGASVAVVEDSGAPR